MNAGFFLLFNSFGAKFQTTFVDCFFEIQNKNTIAWKEVICKVERLNVKQR